MFVQCALWGDSVSTDVLWGHSVLYGGGVLASYHYNVRMLEGKVLTLWCSFIKIVALSNIM